MEKLYNVIETDEGLIATNSNCNFEIIKKYYPEMKVVDYKLTKLQIKSDYKDVKFKTFDI